MRPRRYRLRLTVLDHPAHYRRSRCHQRLGVPAPVIRKNVYPIVNPDTLEICSILIFNTYLR
jgi:hypothetical protein